MTLRDRRVQYETAGLDRQPGAGAAGGLGFGLLAFCGARLMGGDDIHRVRVVAQHGREAGQVADLFQLDLPAVHHQPARAVFGRHEILRRLFLPAGRGMRRQFGQKRRLSIKTGIHRVQDCAHRIIHHSVLQNLGISPSGRIRGAPVLATTSSVEVPAASSTSTSPSGVTSQTARSV